MHQFSEFLLYVLSFHSSAVPTVTSGLYKLLLQTLITEGE